MFHKALPNLKGYSVIFSRHAVDTWELLKSQSLSTSQFSHQTMYTKQIHDLYLFTRTTQAFPLSLCVKCQNKTLINNRKYDTAHTHSFNLLDRPLRSMLCCHIPQYKLECTFLFKPDFSPLYPWDCRGKSCSNLPRVS